MIYNSMPLWREAADYRKQELGTIQHRALKTIFKREVFEAESYLLVQHNITAV